MYVRTYVRTRSRKWRNALGLSEPSLNVSPIPGPKPRPGAPCKPKPGPKPRPKPGLPLQRGPPLPSVPVERSARRGSSRSSRSAPESASRKAGSAAQFGKDTLHITVFKGALPVLPPFRSGHHPACCPCSSRSHGLKGKSASKASGTSGRKHQSRVKHKEAHLEP